MVVDRCLNSNLETLLQSKRTTKGWNKTATVVCKNTTLRSNIVFTEIGDLRRNRKHLRFCNLSSHQHEFDKERGVDEEQTQAEQHPSNRDQNVEQDVPEQQQKKLLHPEEELLNSLDI